MKPELDAGDAGGRLEDLREHQRAIAEVLRAVVRSEGLQPVFDAVVEAAERLCRGESAGLWLLDGGLFRAEALIGAPAEQLEWERAHPDVPRRETLTGRVALTREVVHIPDVLEDPEYHWPGRPSGSYRAMLGVPIVVDDELTGVLAVTRTTPGAFADEEIRLLATFADEAAIAIVNGRLLEAVERQRAELARFVSPQVAALVSSERGEEMLAGHRAYITVFFCDLRGFTAFVETAAPEELFALLAEYHALIGELVRGYGGTLEHFAGDGVMVFFNDPVPVAEHELQAVRMALELQRRFGELASVWRKRGNDLGLGIGIAAGCATLGRIGFEGRYDYGAIGPVTNLASRLSTHAEAGAILVNQRLHAEVEELIEAEPVGEIELKGFARPGVAYRVHVLRAS